MNLKSVVLTILIIAFPSAVIAAPEVIDLRGSETDFEDYWVQKPSSYKLGYPCRAGQEKVTACVEFEFTINSKGKAKKIQVVSKKAEKRFVREAKKALKKMRWEASSKNTNRTPVRLHKRYKFLLVGLPEPTCE